MLVNLYSAKTPIAVFSLPLFIGILAVPIFIFPHEADFHYWNWQNLVDDLVSKQAIIEYALTVVIVSLNAHQINNVYNRHSFFSKATFLPGMIYALGLFALGQMSFSPVLFAHLFMIFALGQFLKLRRQEGAKTIMFWGSLFLGCAMVFSTFSIALLLLPWICLLIFRPFVWREWLLVAFGFALPIVYYVAILYMVKGSFNFDIADPAEPEAIQMDLFQAANYGILILVILGSVYKYIVVLRTEVIRFRKQSLVIFHFLWLGTLIWFIGYQFFNHTYLSFLIPLSFLIATPFLHAKRSSIVNLVVIIWLIISAANVYLVR